MVKSIGDNSENINPLIANYLSASRIKTFYEYRIYGTVYKDK